MKLKKKFLVKLAATLLAIPLILYGGIFLYFYFEKEAPLLTYHINYETDSNRSPAEFATNSEGKRVYINKTDEGTEAEFCWDCYEEAWTKSLRNTLAGWLPSSMRTKKQENGVITCGRGAAQAVVDIGAGAAIIVGGGIAYALEAAHPRKIKLRQHRVDQTKYAFYFVVDGKIFTFFADTAKRLYKHIAKSFKKGDAYAICEMAAVVSTLTVSPKFKANWTKDGAKMEAASRTTKIDNLEKDIIQTRKDIAILDVKYKDANPMDDILKPIKTVKLKKGDNVYDNMAQNHANMSKSANETVMKIVTKASLGVERTALKKDLTAKIKERSALKKSEKITLETKLKQVGKLPLYLLKGLGDEVLDYVPVKATQLIIKPVDKAATTAIKLTPYFAGRNLKDGDEQQKTLQDYLDSLPQTSP